MSKPDFEKGHRVVLEGKVQWAKLHKPDDMSGKYQVDLILDKDSKKQLEDLDILKHVTIKDKDGKEKYDSPAIRLKSGEEYPPTIVDTDNMPFNDMIGNGSKMRFVANIKKYDYKGQKGLSCWLTKGLLLELEEIENNVDSELFGGNAPEPKKQEPSKEPESSDDDLPF